MSLLRKLLIDNTPKDYIKFADPAVEKICAENWGDGTGITYAQAAKVTTLGDKFRGNTEITSFDELQYFYGLKSINSKAFQNCTSMASVQIPETVTYFSTYAFEGCTGLTGKFYAKNVTSLAERSLKNLGSEVIELPSLTTMNYASCGVYPNLKEFICPNLKKVEGYNLNSAPNLETLVFDQSRLVSVGNDFLSTCPKLKMNFDFGNVEILYDSVCYNSYEIYGDVNLPNLKYINGKVLNGSKIAKITNLGSITKSGYYSFGRCTELTEAHFPATVKTIDNGFMYQCTALKVLVMNSESLSQIYTNEMFDKLPSDCKIYVPDASVDTYKGYDGFKKVAGQIYPLSEYVAEE